MQGPFSTRRGIALYLLVWLMLGMLFAGLIIGSAGAAWIDALMFAIPVTLVYAFATGFSSYYLCRAYPLAEKPVAAIVLVFFFSALISSLLWTGFCVLWNSLVSAFNDIGAVAGQAGASSTSAAGIAIAPGLKAMIFGLGMILYGLSAVANYLAIEFQRVRMFERRELELRLAAQEAELRMLRTQIDPHFLFNSLNSISALTSINPSGARDMTLRLADFFRHSLGLEAHKKVSLRDEAALVTHFVAIEKVRFGARLRVEQALDELALACLLPPMILQPLVENAVKHGIGKLPEGGAIRISAERSGSILRIKVENDVDTEPGAGAGIGDCIGDSNSNGNSGGAGIGLANVRQRLAAAYGHEASVNCRREGGTFRVELALPAELPAELPDHQSTENSTPCA